MIARIAVLIALLPAPALAQGGIASINGRGPAYCGGHVSPSALTAAHRSLPCGTLVRVSRGSRSVILRINDRGPFVQGRIIDVTPAAARALGFSGLAHVELKRVR